MVCRRYPGRRPSDYLEIEDDYTALQLDYAVAYKHRRDDFEYENSKIDAIQSMIKPLGQALGVTYSEARSRSNVLPDNLTVDEVLARISGKGTMVSRNG